MDIYRKNNICPVIYKQKLGSNYSNKYKNNEKNDNPIINTDMKRAFKRTPYLQKALIMH